MKNTMEMTNKYEITKDGFYGNFGGQIISEELKKEYSKIAEEFLKIKDDAEFVAELDELLKTFAGRPSPVYYARNLSKKYDAEIYIKREDLNHTGSHKINHSLGEALLAKKMGKTKLIAETGAGQHGVAIATAAALVGLECDVYMGEVDMEKESPNVARMKMLGANVVPVSEGTKTLKEAVDASFAAYCKEHKSAMYAIGSVVGPHPFPMIVEHFQSVIGREARGQMLDLAGELPDYVVACVGGGSNSIGIFNGFLNDEKVKLIGVEPLGKGEKLGDNAASINFGKVGELHGFRSMFLQDEEGNVADAYSVASGLDYPGVGPKHAYLNEIGRAEYVTIDDKEAIDAFFEMSRTEGIIPALESSHAVAQAIKIVKKSSSGTKILINLSGRGDKDLDFILRKIGRHYMNFEVKQN